MYLHYSRPIFFCGNLSCMHSLSRCVRCELGAVTFHVGPLAHKHSADAIYVCVQRWSKRVLCPKILAARERSVQLWCNWEVRNTSICAPFLSLSKLRLDVKNLCNAYIIFLRLIRVIVCAGTTIEVAFMSNSKANIREISLHFQQKC